MKSAFGICIIILFILIAAPTRASDGHHGESHSGEKHESAKHEDSKHEKSGHDEAHHEAVAQAKALPIKWVMQPSDCLGKTLPCAVQFPEKTEAEIDTQKIHVMSGTSIIIHESGKWQLIEGGFWAPELSPISVRFGVLSFEMSGGIFYERKDGQVQLRNLDGQVIVRSESGQAKDVPAGYENWFRGLVRDGSIDSGILRALSGDAFLKAWNQTSDLSSEELEKYFATYKKRRFEAAASAAKIYKDSIVMREVASLEKEQAAAKRLAGKKAEQDEIRALFRQRFFEPPELRSRPALD